MNIIKAFENNNAIMHITVQGTHEEPLFRASDIAAIFEISQINSTIRDFDITEKVMHIINTPGGPQEVTFLTEKGLYEVMFRSRKPIAKQFKNWVYEVIKELRLNGKYQLEKALEEKDEQLRFKDQQSEHSLVLNYRNKNVIYLILIEEIIILGHKHIIVKFGHSKNIEERLRDHKRDFGKNIVLKMIFETNYNKQFEDAIKVKLEQYIKPKIYNGSNKTELIHLTDSFTYDDLIKEIEILKGEITAEKLPELISENNELKLKLAKYEIQEKNLELNKQTDPIIVQKNIKSNQDKIQLYDKNLNLIKTYDTITEACKEYELFKDAVSQSIYRSIKNNTLYKGYRFWKISRDQENIKYEIPETFELSKEQTYQRVVQVKDNNIINVWSCTKSAAENLYSQIQNKTFIPKNEKLLKSKLTQINKSITNSLSTNTNHHAYEHYWYRECDIPEILIEQYNNYKLNNVLPELSVHKNNKKVYKYDINNNLVHIYNSITDARKKEKITEKTINKYISENIEFNSHYFKFNN